MKSRKTFLSPIILSIQTLLVIILVSLAMLCAAQNTIVRGQILDQETSQPLVGVTVQDIRDPAVGTVTDTMGDFQVSLKDPLEATLRISMIGYHPLDYTITPGDLEEPLIILLEVSDNPLEEVVVVGLSEEEERIREVKLNVNPVTVISSAEIENRAFKVDLYNQTIEHLDIPFSNGYAASVLTLPNQGVVLFGMSAAAGVGLFEYNHDTGVSGDQPLVSTQGDPSVIERF